MDLKELITSLPAKLALPAITFANRCTADQPQMVSSFTGSPA